MNTLFRLSSVAASAMMFAGVAGAADMPVKAPAASAGPSAIYFGGAAVSPHSWFADVGAVWAFNRNLNTDGALLRINGGIGEYNYLILPGMKNGVEFQTGEVMVGYQKIAGNVRYTGYIGAQVQHHDNEVDPNASIHGTKWGVVGQGEIFATLGDRAYGLLLGQASSVWSSYYVLAKYGHYVSRSVSVGPEISALGNKCFEAQRLGLFAAFDVTSNFHLVVSGGYHWQDESFRDGDGGYATVHLRLAY